VVRVVRAGAARLLRALRLDALWHPKHAHAIAVSAGSVDAPTGLRLTAHIFTDEQRDYYGFTDDVPKRAKF
jgi:hypothetical protein